MGDFPILPWMMKRRRREVEMETEIWGCIQRRGGGRLRLGESLSAAEMVER